MSPALLRFGLVALLLVACSGDDDSGVTPSSACTPGESKACVGPAGCTGGQVCAADGKSYGVCDCGNPKGDAASSAGGNSGAGGASGGAGVSSGGAGNPPVDLDAAAVKDAATSDSCTPQEAGFPMTYIPATAAHQGLCSTQQIADFWTACFSATATGPACDTLVASAANNACVSCILPPGNTRLGPLVRVMPTVVDINYGGCMELLGGSTGLECAKAYQAAQLCTAAACANQCRLSDGAIGDPEMALCRKRAATGVCASYQQQTTCTRAAGDAGAGACLLPGTEEEHYRDVAAVFCGN